MRPRIRLLLLLLLLLLLPCVPVYAFTLAASKYTAIGQSSYVEINLAGTVSYTLPPQTTFVAATSPDNLPCTTPAVGQTGVVTCPPGYYIHVWFALPANTPPGTVLTHTATSGSETVTTTSVAQPLPDLKIVSTLPSSFVTGIPFGYDITVTNNGPLATGVFSFHDDFNSPITLAYVTINQLSGPDAHCYLPGSAHDHFSCIVPSLNPGEGFHIAMTLNSLPPGPDVLEHMLLYGYQDWGYGGHIWETSVENKISDLVVASSAPVLAEPNGDLPYSVFVTNSGPSTATNVTFSWTTPPGTTFLSLDKPALAPSGYELMPVTCTTPPAGSAGTVTCTTVFPINPASQSSSYWDGAPGMYTVVFHVRVPGTPGTVTNSVSGTSDHDPNAANNTSSATTTILPAAAANLSLSMQASQPSAVMGSPVTYSARVTNGGPSAAQNVRVTLSVPPGMTMVSQPAGCTNAFQVVCTLPSLANGSTFAFDLGFTGTTLGTKVSNGSVTSDTQDLDPSNNAAAASCVITPRTSDLRVAYVVTPPTVVLGDTFTGYVLVDAVGPDTVDGVASVTLPPEIQPTSADAPCVVKGSQVVCAANFAHDSRATFTFTGKTLATGTFKVSATLGTSGNDVDPNPANNSGEATITVLATPPPPTDADVMSTITPPPLVSLTSGTVVTYVATITNKGPAAAANVSLLFVTGYEGSLALQTFQASPQLTCQAASTRQLNCTLPLLASGATASVNANFLVVGGPGALVSVNTEVRSSNSDPNSFNNYGSSVTTVTAASSHLALSVDTASITAVAGQPLAFTITVMNKGLGPLNDVVIEDDLPPAVTLVSARPSVGTCAGSPLICHIGTLAADTVATLRVSVTLSGLASVTNHVTASGDDQTAGADIVLSPPPTSRRRAARH
jgi:uncharacterized repeat protein (TIGR01451 family)